MSARMKRVMTDEEKRNKAEGEKATLLDNDHSTRYAVKA